MSVCSLRPERSASAYSATPASLLCLAEGIVSQTEILSTSKRKKFNKMLTFFFYFFDARIVY